MRFEQPPNTEPNRKLRRPPPNYFSRSVRLRMATLVALLGLVLVAMHEAGDPETWRRMGFAEPAAKPEIDSVASVDQGSKTINVTQLPIEQAVDPDLAAEAGANSAVLSDDERAAFDEIQDYTAMNRADEKPAWAAAWKLIDNADEDAAEATAVSYVELVGQPNAWRGKWVRVIGHARGIEAERSHDRNGKADYSVLWIKPEDSNRTPYCIYVRELPPGIPQPTDEFQKLDLPIEVEGLFFKLRSYVATNQQVESCPLILARSVRLQPVPAATQTTPWSPPIWLLILFFVGMPIVAAFLAIIVYRSSQSIPRPDSPNQQQQIESSLSHLQQDPTVQSDREEIAALKREHASDSDS